MIAARVAKVRERIERAARRSGRRVDEVTIVAVSKTKTADDVRAGYEAGLRVFGENKVQEAEAKATLLASLREAGLRWHLVGHLQNNKARKAAALFECVHSLDREDLARRLARLGRERGRPIRALVQVNLSQEPTKRGVSREQLPSLLASIRELEGLSVDGLMTMPAYRENPEDVRSHFARLRELRDDAERDGLLAGSELSMGMSHDFEVAVEEGATLVRVGTALFGPRPNNKE